VADALSRMFDTPPDEVPNQVSCQLTLTNFPLAFVELSHLQRQYVELNDIMDKLGQGDTVENYVLSQCNRYWAPKRGRGRKLVVPVAAVPMVFSYFHDSPLGGHLGVRKTINKIRDQFIWKGMYKDIRATVRFCNRFALTKPAQTTVVLYGF
jgi:hypothetical protein